MAERATIAAGSPESIPSLELSQVSTNSTEEDEDSLKLMCEVPANSSSRSGFQYHTLFDIDEEDNISLSSGILSTSSLDLSLDQHSFASMETIKLQNSKEAKSPDTIFESVEAEDIPASRACHGALSITPKQLGGVFALFSSEKTPKQQWPPPASTVQEGKKPLGNDTAAVSVSAPVLTNVQPAASPELQNNDYPMSMEERSTTNVTNHRRLSSELFWKPRAKSLEKECTALKEIIRVDSSNIVKLKAAIETLEERSSLHLAEIQSLKEQLNNATHDLNVLKREREMLLEHETEHRETIRILKHEVDILTREGNSPWEEKAVGATSDARQNQEELRQLRLENQLFASQIVEYEAELNCITFMEKQQEQLQQQVQSMQRRLGAQARSSENSSPEGSQAYEGPFQEDQGVNIPLQAQGSQTRYSFYTSEEHLSTQPSFPIPEDLGTAGNEEEEDAMRTSEERRQFLLKQLLANDSDAEEAKQQEEAAHAEAASSDKLSSDASSQTSLDVLKDHVLGMFTLKNSSEDRKEQEEDRIYIVHEQEVLSDAVSQDEVECLQWQDPESPPTFVKMENIGMKEEPEDRNPPLTLPFPQNPQCSPKTVPCGWVSIRDVSEHWNHADNQNEVRDETTAIEVLAAGEASEAIEVQLSPRRSFDDDNKENQGESNTYLCSSRCDENCDAWSAVSDCLLFTTKDAQ